MTAWTVLLRDCPCTHPVTQHTARPNQAEYSQAAAGFLCSDPFHISVQKFQLLDCLLAKVSINIFCDIAVFLYLARKSLPQSEFLFTTFFFFPRKISSFKLLNQLIFEDFVLFLNMLIIFNIQLFPEYHSMASYTGHFQRP